MYIKNIKLQNFGQFQNEGFNFTYPGVNVIIANNGKGKSTLLDSLSVVLGTWLLGIKGVDSRHIRDYEARRDNQDFNKVNYPVVINADVEIYGTVYNITRDKINSDKKTRYIEAKLVKELAEKTYATNQKDLPLLVYYGTGRRWLEPKESKENEYLNTSRIDGYRYSVDPRVNIKLFTEWFKNNKDDVKVIIIKKALQSCLEDCTNLYYDHHFETLLIEFNYEKVIPFTHLSDGQKTLLAMVADMAFKIVTLNPHYKDFKAIERTTGCVLIDEIDLHLHPKWQREVLDNLSSTFRMIQFIVTTHSPFIVQSIGSGTLIRLNSDDEKDFIGLSIEEIAEELMNIELPQRSKKFVHLFNVAKEYYNLLDELELKPNHQSEVDRLENELHTLLIPFSDDPAHAAYLSYLKSEKISRNL